MTNNVGLILPEDGFHEGLRRLTRDAGTLLAYDETHTQVVGPGGLTAQWSLDPDFVTAGKSIAGGVPFGAWGMREETAMFLTQFKGPDGERFDMVAIGGTLFGNALSMAAARATMLEVLTPEAYAHTQRLGATTRRRHARERRDAPGSPGTSMRSAPAPATPSSRSRSATPKRAARARTICSRD